MDFSVTTFKDGKRDSGMIDVNKLPEFPGFTVYDAETGEPIQPDTKVDDVETVMHILAEDGTLYIANCACEGLPKGKYIIQMDDGTFYRW